MSMTGDFQRVVLLAGGVGGARMAEGLARALPASALTVIANVGDDDEFYTQDQFRKFDDALAARLPNYRSKHYNAKHEITDEMREDMKAFLVDA